MYVKQPLEDAVQEVLQVLGRPSDEWKDSRYAKFVQEDEKLSAMQWEMDEAVYILRAALGMPVPRQVCGVCDARDSIYWERNPIDHEKAPKDNPDKKMWCHSCGTVDPKYRWIDEIVDA